MKKNRLLVMVLVLSFCLFNTFSVVAEDSRRISISVNQGCERIVISNSEKIDIQQISVLKRDRWEGRNLLSPIEERQTHNGVVFTFDNGIYTANGMATDTAFLQLDGSSESVPEWAYALSGETIQVQYSTDSLLRLMIRVYSKDAPEGYILLDTRRGTSFEMPDVSQLTGMWIRLQAPTGAMLNDVKVKPILSWHSREKNPPMLTLIDDDGDIKYYEQLYPLAREKGVSVSSAVTITRVESGLERWMNWEQIQEVHANGMEVLCHTYSHPKPADLEDVTREELVQSYRLAKETMQQKGVYSADFIVYSSSTGNMEIVRDAAREVFRGGALVGYNSTNFRNSDPYALTRYRIDYDYNYDQNTILGLIDELKTNGGWMIWMFHSSESAWNADCLETIGTAIDYAKEVGVPIVTAEEGMEAYFG